jgi:hypothetical protein
MPKSACLAIVLVNPKDPDSAASYHWCKSDEHDEEEMHECYCGIWWLAPKEDLIPPTRQMIQWRTGARSVIKRVSGHMLG